MAVGELVQPIEQLVHHGAGADHRVRVGRTARAGGARGGAQDLVLADHAMMIDRAFDGHEELVAGERLRDVVVRSLLHRVDGGLDRAVGGHEENGKVFVDGTDLGKKLEPVHLRHLEIGDDDVRTPRGDLLDRRLAAGRGGHDVALSRQRRGDAVAHHFLVIDDKDLAH